MQQRKDYAGALRQYERALRITEAALGPDHPDAANWLNNLATVRYLQGDRDAARAPCWNARSPSSNATCPPTTPTSRA